MIKTAVYFIFCFLFLTVSLFAQEDEIAWKYEDGQDTKITSDADVVWTFEDHEEVKTEEIIIEKEKGLVRIADRKWEIGVFNFNFGLSNDFMGISDIFRDKINIDLDKLSDGFRVNANLSVSPVFFTYNIDDSSGFGISTGLDLIGIANLNGDMLTFQETNTKESDIGAAIFTEVKFHGFFTYEKFKIKIKPAVYYPILYAEPNNFSYAYYSKETDGKDETYLNMDLDMRVYTAYPTNDDFKFKDIFNFSDTISNISASPGIDISIGVEYPLSETLGLTEKYNFLDFDVGIDLINIPLYPSAMEDYMRMIINVGSDKPIDLFNGMFSEGNEGNDNFYNYSVEEHGKDKKNVFRPFKLLLSANWRPFYRPSGNDTDEWIKRKKEWLTFTPVLGFAVNPLYFQPVSFEGGIKTRLSLANLFIISLDIGYHDRLWKNGLDLGFNFRFFEVDFGIGMQSPAFLKSWSGGGFSASFGLKFGW